jgi:hypothetical protein
VVPAFCFSFPHPPPSVLQCPSWILAVYFRALFNFRLFTVLHAYLHSCSSGPESWYLPAESRAVRVRPLSGPGRPYRDSAQVVICIQSMQTFSLTLSPKLLHDSPTKSNRMIAVPLCLFRNLSGFVGRHMTKVMIHLETFLKHSLLIHKVAARSLVLSCESSCAA